MTEREELIEKLRSRPILLNLQADTFGQASGALSIPKEGQDIAFTYVRNTEPGFTASSFSAVSPYGHFFIALGGHHTAAGELFSKLNGQHEAPYEYILFSSRYDVVTATTFDEARFTYHTFIEGVPVGTNEPASVSLFDHHKRAKRVCRTFRLDVRLSSTQRQQSFPYKKTVEYDKLDFVLRFTKPKTIDEIRRVLHELNNYLTLFLQTPAKPVEILLTKQVATKEGQRPQTCCLLERTALSEAPKPTQRGDALSFSRQGKAFLAHLTNAIYYQERLKVPLNLIRAYWVYKHKKVYLDNQVSVLLAAADALYGLVHIPTARQEKREKQFEAFLSQLETIEVPADLKKWLGKAQSFYTDPRSFAEKIKVVVAYAEGEISEAQATALNELRNDLMHGRFPEWEHYISSYFERRSGTEGDKVDLRWLAWILSAATLKLIRNTGKRTRDVLR